MFLHKSKISLTYMKVKINLEANFHFFHGSKRKKKNNVVDGLLLLVDAIRSTVHPMGFHNNTNPVERGYRYYPYEKNKFGCAAKVNIYLGIG